MSSVQFFSRQMKRVALFAISSIVLVSIKWLLGDSNDTLGNRSVFPTANADVVSDVPTGECEGPGDASPGASGDSSAEGAESCAESCGECC